MTVVLKCFEWNYESNILYGILISMNDSCRIGQDKTEHYCKCITRTIC